MGIGIKGTSWDSPSISLTEHIGESEEKSAFKSIEELVKGRRILYIEQDDHIEELDCIPKSVEVGNPIFEEVDEGEEENEPAESWAELTGVDALVDGLVVVGHESRELKSDIGSLERVAGGGGKDIMGRQRKWYLFWQSGYLQN